MATLQNQESLLRNFLRFIKRRIRRIFAKKLNHDDLIHWPQIDPIYDFVIFKRWLHRLGVTAFLNESTPESFQKVIAIYENRPDLRALFPLGITPLGMKPFLGILILTEVNKNNLSLSDIISFFSQVVANPAPLLEITYLNQPDWQKLFPLALFDLLQWKQFLNFIQQTFSTEEDWINFAPLPTGYHKPATQGVNVLGHFGYPSGLQVAAQAVVDAFSNANYQVLSRQVPASPNDNFKTQNLRSLLLQQNTIIVMAPEPLFHDCFNRAGVYSFPNSKIYAIWYWELEEAPYHWRDLAIGLTEIWAPTQHIQHALMKVVSVPVVPMLPAITLPSFSPLSRKELNLPENDFLFLFVFDLASIMERKNPLGLIRAFKSAFTNQQNTRLILKINRASQYPNDMAILRNAIAGLAITIIDAAMEKEEVAALMNACDCYVSLHRSEGLGLTIAEAMLLGKPVIATNYSGNTDYMDIETSLLVKYKRVALEEDYPPYCKGWHWAQPDEQDAADKMRWVFENQPDAKIMGHRAKLKLEKLLSPLQAAQRMIQRIHHNEKMEQPHLKID